MKIINHTTHLHHKAMPEINKSISYYSLQYCYSHTYYLVISLQTDLADEGVSIEMN